LDRKVKSGPESSVVAHRLIATYHHLGILDFKDKVRKEFKDKVRKEGNATRREKGRKKAISLSFYCFFLFFPSNVGHATTRPGSDPKRSLLDSKSPLDAPSRQPKGD
jgi:hypothetical protein